MSMVHHAEGAYHFAHDRRVGCTLSNETVLRGGEYFRVQRRLCEMPVVPVGEDGKCDWCRRADEKRAS